MPELPEVETVRCGLAKHLIARTLTAVEIRQSRLRWAIPTGLADSITGSRVSGIRRRGKYLLWDLSNDAIMLMHLGMSGSLRILRTNGSHDLKKHDHVIWHLDTHAAVSFHDPRRFGMIDLLAKGGEPTNAHLRILGPEPLESEFDTSYLANRLARRKIPIKTALLDQKLVAGIGNIYASEILWEARIAPQTPSLNLHAGHIDALVEATRTILYKAIEASGSSLRNYRSLEGEVGSFQSQFTVYDREGCPCPRPGCEGLIARLVQSGRSTFHCPHCQTIDHSNS